MKYTKSLDYFVNWQLFALAIVLVLALWMLVILFLSVPPSEAKQIERPIQHSVQDRTVRA